MEFLSIFLSILFFIFFIVCFLVQYLKQLYYNRNYLSFSLIATVLYKESNYKAKFLYYKIEVFLFLLGIFYLLVQSPILYFVSLNNFVLFLILVGLISFIIKKFFYYKVQNYLKIYWSFTPFMFFLQHNTILGVQEFSWNCFLCFSDFWGYFKPFFFIVYLLFLLLFYFLIIYSFLKNNFYLINYFFFLLKTYILKIVPFKTSTALNNKLNGRTQNHGFGFGGSSSGGRGPNDRKKLIKKILKWIGIVCFCVGVTLTLTVILIVLKTNASNINEVYLVILSYKNKELSQDQINLLSEETKNFIRRNKLFDLPDESSSGSGSSLGSRSTLNSQSNLTSFFGNGSAGSESSRPKYVLPTPNELSQNQDLSNSTNRVATVASNSEAQGNLVLGTKIREVLQRTTDINMNNKIQVSSLYDSLKNFNDSFVNYIVNQNSNKINYEPRSSTELINFFALECRFTKFDSLLKDIISLKTNNVSFDDLIFFKNLSEDDKLLLVQDVKLRDLYYLILKKYTITDLQEMHMIFNKIGTQNVTSTFIDELILLLLTPLDRNAPYHLSDNNLLINILIDISDHLKVNYNNVFTKEEIELLIMLLLFEIKLNDINFFANSN